MVITIKNDESRFGVRVAAIIYNKDMSKVFMQRQGNNDFYMFPGGRLEVLEDTKDAIKRELIEELGIKEEIYLKYISENFIKFPNLKYHEIGFYFITQIDEDKYGFYENNEYDSLDEEKDGKSTFKWIDIDKIDNIKIMPNCMKNKLNIKKIDDSKVEHIVYKEY